MRHIRFEPDRTSHRRGARAAIHLRFILISLIFIGTVATAASFIDSRVRATTALAGIVVRLPNCFTEVASTTCKRESCVNAMSAASSAVLAPPERHEASNTPDRHRPRPSIP